MCPVLKSPRQNWAKRNSYQTTSGPKFPPGPYKEALKIANLTTLEVRREKMCLKFAKDCLKIDKLKQMFPSNSKDHDMENRNTKKFKVNHAKTERYLKSSIPYLQRLLNTQWTFIISSSSSEFRVSSCSMIIFIFIIHNHACLKYLPCASTYTPNLRLFILWI